MIETKEADLDLTVELRTDSDGVLWVDLGGEGAAELEAQASSEGLSLEAFMHKIVRKELLKRRGARKDEKA